MATQCPKCNAENPETAKFCSECAALLKPSKDIGLTKTIETPVEDYTRGSTFAERYKIIEKLGTGGMGAVYKVEDTKIGQDIALKLIKPEIASDKKTIERFRNELKTTRMISHRNVCRMFDLGETADVFYITMEYVSGEDLKSFVRRSGRLDIPKAISIAKEICEGLSEAHRLDVVHRDLKSNNIMIDKKGNARIMDFGIARSLSAKGLTGEGVIIGTPEYMSPEQAEAKDVDLRSDIYSLGVILYEMTTGQLPFEGETPLSIAMKHKGEMPKDPRLLHAQIPEDLSHVIMRCLEKEKEERYQSADELRSELENIEKGIPTTEREVPEHKPLTSKEITIQLSLKKLFIPALFVVALVVTGLILWKFLPKEKAIRSFPSDRPSLAVMYFMNQTGDETLDHWREALPSWLITDLSQSKYINILPEDRLFSILRKLNLLKAQNYASEDLKNLAIEGGVGHIFQARYSKAGEIFRIDYSLQRTDTLEIIASDYVSGKNEESFPSLVDEITKKIKANLKLSEEQLSSDLDKDAGAITTSSPEAFRYYSLGRKFQLQADRQKAMELLEQAVTIDPEFAMAYRALAMLHISVGNRSKAEDIYQKALKLTDRLSDKERYQIEADFYLLSENTYDKAIEAYKEMLGIYPDNTQARHNLAWVYAQIEDNQKAAEQYEININIYKTDELIAYTGLAFQYRRLGLYDKARDTYEEYLNRFQDNISIHRSLAANYRHQGKYELALDEIDKAFSLDPTLWGNIRRKGDIYFHKGDFIQAEAEYRKLLEREERSANYSGMSGLSRLFLIQGRYNESIDQARKVLELAEERSARGWIRSQLSFLAYMDRISGDPEEALKKYEIVRKSAIEAEDFGSQRRSLRQIGLTYIEMKQTAEAQRVAEEYKEIIEQAPNKNLIRWHYHFMGRIEIERKNYAKAIEYYKKALPLLSATSAWRIVFVESLGRAHYESGDLEKARAEYGKISSPTTSDKMTFGDVYAKSFYMLGKINEELGDKAKAIEHYEKFLDLWKDADPGIAEVDDARERLAGLKSE